jgi:hypothetical protein
MDADFDENVDRYASDQPTGNCRTGPNQDEWNRDGEVLGRLLCAPQTVGIRFDWTHESGAILSTLIDFDGDYDTTYDTWVNAGPV